MRVQHPGLLDSELAVLRTVSYSSLFSYPLSLHELHRYLIGHSLEERELEELIKSSHALREVVDVREGYYFLRAQPEGLAERRVRQSFSLEILEANRRILKLICAIPYVQMVALSGSAAHLNLSRDGDIDLFIVTRRGHTWSGAFTILVLARILGKRKLICFNFLTSEDWLELEQKDLFSANQVASLKILTGAGTARKFLAENPFVSRFYPNFSNFEPAPLDFRPGWLLGRLKWVLEIAMWPGISQMVEQICRRIYRNHLQRRSDSWPTPEEVVLTENRLKLHTHGHRKQVYRRYQRILVKVSERLGLPITHGASQDWWYSRGNREA